MSPNILESLTKTAKNRILKAALALSVGFVGYNVEWMIRKEKNTPWRVNSTMVDRDERKLKEASEGDPTQVNSLKSKKDHPTTILGRNDAIISESTVLSRT